MLDIVQSDHVAFFDEQIASAREEDLLGIGQLDLFSDLVLQILNQYGVVLVEHGEPVASHPNRIQTGRSSTFRSYRSNLLINLKA